MDIGSLLLGLALLLVVGFIVARPLVEQRSSAEKTPSTLEQLLAAREQNLTALRDLDFDHTTGKITPEDYQVERVKLVAQGVNVLKQLDALGHQNVPATATTEDAIEAAVAQRRKTTPATNIDEAMEAAIAHRRAPQTVTTAAPSNGSTAACPGCQAKVHADDKFCPTCGVALHRACPQCGHAALPGDKFCAKCGTTLPALAAV